MFMPIRTVTLSAVLACTAALASELSQGSPQDAARGAGSDPAKSVLTAQELLANPQAFSGKTVRVGGEVAEKLDPRSFILESGGGVTDELVVVVPKLAEGLDLRRLRGDSDVIVRGSVRAVPLVEIEREVSWDFNPLLERQIEGARAFFIAERISVKPRNLGDLRR
jgi:hypothetical protein